jgi:hypothetical protein
VLRPQNDHHSITSDVSWSILLRHLPASWLRFVLPGLAIAPRLEGRVLCLCGSLVDRPTINSQRNRRRLFIDCNGLRIVTFPVDSEVIRIEDNALDRCGSLKSLVLRSSVELIGVACFDRCKAVSKRTFELPSHPCELPDIPSTVRDYVDIPDSVEVLWTFGSFKRRSVHVLCFGDESRLDVIMAKSGNSRSRYSFLRVASRSVKRFRMNLEFARDA